MKRWLKRTLIGVFGASLLLGGAAWSQRHAHPGWHHWSEEDAAKMKARLVERVGRQLDLDDAQKTRLGQLADTLREQRKSVVGGDPKAALAALVAGPAFDRSGAQALLETKTQAVAAQGPALIAALADFYDSLRPEQQQKVRDFMSRAHHGRG